MTTPTLDLTPASSRKQRIAAVRDMARQLRYFFDSQGSYRFAELEDLIKKQERRHRSGLRNGYAEPVAVAVDYFLVRCIWDAFQVFEKNDGAVPASALTVRTDYLLALALVAEWSLHNPVVRALSSMDDRRNIEQSIDLGELKHAATLLDYSDDIARR
jgi:hypothetical protein